MLKPDSRPFSLLTRAARLCISSRLLVVLQLLIAPMMWSGGIPVLRAQEAWTVLPTIDASEDTATTAQSKAWFHGHTWWTVLPSSTPSGGSWLYRLEPDNTWTQVLRVSTMKGKADVRSRGDLAHILLVSGSAQIVTIEYVPALQTYQPWSVNPTPTTVFVGETGNIEVDSTGRMWLAIDHFEAQEVFYSDPPYTSFTGPIFLTQSADIDDISAIVAFPNQSIGVMWSDGVTDQWAFKVHRDGDDPAVWSADEAPLSIYGGMEMADDHINLALGADGTLYAAVKARHTSDLVPNLYMMVRRPQPGGFGGTWDNVLYTIDPTGGRRPALVLNEDTNTLRVFYTDSSGTVYFRDSDTTNISFGPQQTLMTGGLDYPTSTKDTWTGRLVVLATGGGAQSRLMITTPDLVGYWKMDEAAGAAARDFSGWGNDATFAGSPSRTASVNGLAVSLDGSTTYGSVSDQMNLDATTGLTLSAWIKPQAQGAQDIISRATMGSVDGYALSLLPSNAATNPGTVSFLLNEASSGNTFRVDSATQYPFNGNTWMHVAASYDGTAMRIYINGVEERSSLGPPSIAANVVSVGLGAQADGGRKFSGLMDEVRIYQRALSSSEIVALSTVPHADLLITKSDAVSSVLVGAQTTYTIQASNAGPDDILATITDVLPSRLTGAAWTCAAAAGASCTASGSGGLNQVVSLPVGGSVTYTLTGTVTTGSGSTLVNTATVSPTNGIDPAPGNNSATDTDTIQLPPAPQITTQPTSITVTAPGPATFSVVATGTVVNYQWRRNGSNISGATSSSYTVPSTAVSDSGASFTVVVSNAAGSVTSAAATLTVNPAPTPASITTQPASVVVIESTSATFSVVAAGTSPLSYQWRRNGTNIPGATGATYTTPPTALGDSGAIYSVFVSNAIGNATSAPATLTVLEAGATLLLAGFDGSADGFEYIDDAFRATVEPLYASGAHLASGGVSGGALQVLLGGINGSNISKMSGAWRRSFVLSGSTTLTLSFRYRLTGANTDPDEFGQMLVDLDGVLRGTPPNDYLAQLAGNSATTTTGWQLVQMDLGTLPTGTHVLSLGGYLNKKGNSNETVEVLIDDLLLTVGGGASGPAPPSITSPPGNTTVVAPSSATFSVVAGGTSPLSYQWRRNSGNISGATGASYTLPSTTMDDSGAIFDVVVTNSAGSITSPSAMLTVNAAPVAPSITTPPANATVTAPAPATFSVVAAGTGPLGYQWRRDGTPIPGANGTSYTLPFTTLGDDDASFDVIVSNSAGAATSAAALLNVNAAPVAPSIVTPPANATVTAPAPATFSVSATGTAPLSYQWYRNASIIPGAIGSSYTLASTATTDNGASFTVVVSNTAGSVTSAPATLTVQTGGGGGSAIIDANFDAGVDGFVYADDLFRATTQPNYASGGLSGGALRVLLGGIDGANIEDISGGWQRTFMIAAPTQATLSFRYRLTSDGLDLTELSQVLVSLDGVLRGIPPNDYVVQLICVDCVGETVATTGWQTVQLDLGTLAAGSHVLALGSYINKKTASSETAELLLDDVRLGAPDSGPVAPTIVSPPANVTVTAPNPATFSVVASGTSLGYQWQKNGANIPGATSASYTTPATSAGDSGATFRVVVSNSAGSVTSAAATLTVNSAPTAPSITSPPASVVVIEPGTATFSVVATGTSPLNYQWQKNGANIPGATGASYTTPPTSAGESGATFTVVVSNSVGTVTSTSAALTVLDGTGSGGAALLEASFDAGADGFVYADDLFRGTDEFNYASGGHLPGGGFSGGGLQVLLGGIDGRNKSRMSGGWQRSFPAAATAELTLSFRYRLTGANTDPDEFGQILVSLDGVLIGTPPNDYIVQLVGNSATTTTGWQLVQINLGTVPAGTHLLSLGAYLNKKGGSSEAVEALIDDILLTAGGSVSGPTPPSITTPPLNMTVTAPAGTTFSVVAGGTAPLGYQWRRNSTDISGATGPSYTVASTTIDDSGDTFDVVVTNSAGSITSPSATLTVNAATEAPSISTPPANTTVTAPAPATFSVVAAGTGPLGYQWRRDGTPIPGANGTSYTLPFTTLGDNNASFDVVVSNTGGSVTSTAAMLTVNAAPVAPSITTQPAGVVVTAPAPATFSVVAGGTAPLGYQWWRNGTAIPGATGESYTVNPTALTQSGDTFSVVITNSAGTVTSETATLTVLDGGGSDTTLINASFDTGVDGFVYADDVFRGADESNYASGAHLAGGGFSGGGLQVLLGGIDGRNKGKMSGGWQRGLTLAASAAVTVSFRYRLTGANIDADEFVQMLVGLDAVLIGTPPNDYIVQLVGNNATTTTGWQQVQVNLGTLPAGNHVLTLGAYLNKKGNSDESGEVVIDDVLVTQ